MLMSHANITTAAAFIPLASHWQTRNFGLEVGNALRGSYVPSVKKELQAAYINQPDSLPPWDDTVTLVGKARELLTAPDGEHSWKRYDEIGQDTGGTWRSNAVGFVPTTVRFELCRYCDEYRALCVMKVRCKSTSNDARRQPMNIAYISATWACSWSRLKKERFSLDRFWRFNVILSWR